MRNAVVKELIKLARKDKNLYLITGDLGYGVLTPFWEEFPDRFINAGICEQNMISVAAGLAFEGKKVFVYSIANFPTFRCLEQIRNDVAYHNLNVNIMTVGGGFIYGSLGVTHHATEDIGIVRPIPDMRVFAPSDPVEAVNIVKYVYNKKWPCYIRLGKGGEKNIHKENFNFKIGDVYKIKEGKDGAILFTGTIISEILKAHEKLKSKNKKVAIYSLPTIKPLNENIIKEIIKKYKFIFTVEEHNIIGGLSSSIADIIATYKLTNTRLIKFGINDKFTYVAGTREYLLKINKLDANTIYKKILQILNKRG